MNKKSLLALALTLALVSAARATILNVPSDYATIQGAIDASADGDTVLVAPGTYYENIYIAAKNIIVTGDRENPESVVIDGNSNGSVVTFDGAPIDSMTLFSGFSIRGGRSVNGGGLLLISSHPRLSNLIIAGNEAVGQGTYNGMGGGIWCYYSNPTLANIVLTGNIAQISGGGIGCVQSTWVATQVLSYGNSAGLQGGAFWLDHSEVTFINCTVSQNQIDGGGQSGGFGTFGTTIQWWNSILWNNQPNEGEEFGGSSISLGYSDIRGGQNGIRSVVADWQQGNIDADPLFVDPDNGDFHLTAISPCIDTGDPDSPLDPDGTRADMGAYWEASFICWVEKPDTVNVDENDRVEFNVRGESRDENAILTITYNSDNIPEAAQFADNGNGSGTFIWQTTYFDAGEYTAHFTLSDGESEVTADVPIRVNDVVIAPRLPTWLISIKASSGFYNSGDCYVGGAEEASYGYDLTYDFIAPPTPPGGYVDAYFPHPDWENELGDNYRTDVYPVDCDLNGYATWDFEVNTNLQSRDVNLDFLPDSMVRPTSNIYLHDLANDSLQNLRRISRYRYRSAADGGTRSFRLLVGTGELNVSQEVSSGWNLISFPRNPLDPNTGRVIGDDIPSIYYLYDYSKATGYKFADSVEAGRGYWLGMNYGAELDVEGGTLLEYYHPLTPGWQLIGCPYDRPVAFNRAKFLSYGRWYSFSQAVQRGLIQDVLYGFTEGDNGYTDGDTLNPWRGYWISAGSLPVTMSIPPPEGVLPDMAPRRPQPFIASSDNWQLEIFAALSNGYDDRLTQLGVEPDATDGFDSPYDCPEPPAPPGGNYVTAYFPHQGWSELLDDRFNTDFRGALQEGETQIWDLTVETNSASEVTLSWENLLATTPDYEFYLKDIMTGTEFSLYDAATYKYISEGIREFNVRTVAVSSGRRSDESLPGEFALRSIHPNPFNTATTITCDLPEAALVTLSAYDLGGREVAAIYNGKLTAGQQRILWDASGLSSGIYLVKLQSAGNIRTARVALVR